jgi:nicotinate dehydrogenase subunit B
MNGPALSRRQFGLGAAAILAGVTIGFRFAASQGGSELPAMIKRNPGLDSWVRIAPDGSITVLTGRVEIGQGCLTAMRQIAADELDVAPEKVTLISGDTGQCPDEGVTSGSLAVKLGGSALGLACADARATLVKVAAEAWGVGPDRLRVENGVILGPADRRMSYGEAAGKVSLSRPVDPSVKRKPASQQRVVGTSLPRTDIPAKVFGQQVFIHDMRPEGMLYGAVARPPAYSARLRSVALEPARALPGVVNVVRDGSFLGVVAHREEQAYAAAERLAAWAEWDKGEPLFGGKSVFDYLLTEPVETKVIHTIKADARPSALTHSGEYRRAFMAHASIGASCALARWDGDHLTVWSHTQGPYPLRGELAKVFKKAPDTIRVIHEQGAGCYGHNGADDVALDAALLARSVPGRPVRVNWTHEQEMAWEPWGSAMLVRLSADVSAEGTLVSWSHDVWSFPHSTRPTAGAGCNLRSAWYLAEPLAPAEPVDGPLPSGASARNAVPIYAVANQIVTTHFHTKMPVRTSALRTLGGYFNTLAAESFMDELAARVGRDPVSFRLANLKDERLATVLRKAVEICGWKPRVVTPRPIGAEMIGTGVGLSRYKNSDSNVAVVARVAVDGRSGRVRLLGLWSATETGRAINPDGVINQIEGGMVQSASWTLMEAGRWNDGIMVAVDYAGYPIIDFPAVPEIKSVLIDRPDLPSLGVGEGSSAPTGAAIANAIFDATGRRPHEVPFTPQRVKAALAA